MSAGERVRREGTGETVVHEITVKMSEQGSSTSNNREGKMGMDLQFAILELKIFKNNFHAKTRCMPGFNVHNNNNFFTNGRQQRREQRAQSCAVLYNDNDIAS